MAASLSSSSFIHPQLRHIVSKMTLFDTLLYISWTSWGSGTDYQFFWDSRIWELEGICTSVTISCMYNAESADGGISCLLYRTADGNAITLVDDIIGSQGTFFVATCSCKFQDIWLLDPHPTVVANKLLARNKFIDNGKQFNMIACSWIQFMIHDWIDHMEDTQQVELQAPDKIADGCPLKSFKFYKTKRVSTGSAYMKTGSLNTRTPWWMKCDLWGMNEDG
uniref:Uncharacterized protein n=1 Tax=Salix viminalis TaxID=40686 RepID=A0A6N2KJU5_SALVM